MSPDVNLLASRTFSTSMQLIGSRRFTQQRLGQPRGDHLFSDTVWPDEKIRAGQTILVDPVSKPVQDFLVPDDSRRSHGVSLPDTMLNFVSTAF